MAYGLSNGHVTDDVAWPWKVLWGNTVGYPSDSLASRIACVRVCIRQAAFTRCHEPTLETWHDGVIEPHVCVSRVSLITITTTCVVGASVFVTYYVSSVTATPSDDHTQRLTRHLIGFHSPVPFSYS